MHETVEKQSTAILQRAGQERRCAEMKRRRVAMQFCQEELK